MRISTIQPVAKSFALIGLLILGGIIYLSLIPMPTFLEATRGQATIRFSADHNLVFAAGSCVEASWTVEHIREVYLNGAGVVGSGEQELCLDRDTQPTLRVVFQDGAVKTYQLNTVILLTQPAVWILIVMGVTFLLAASCLTVMRFIHLSSRIKLAVQIAVGSLLTVVVAVVLIESVLRTYFTLFGSQQDQLLYMASQSDIRATIASHYNIVPVPYLNYVNNPSYQDINSLGYRGTEVKIPKPQGVFRIVVIGDSISFGLSLTPNKAYPAQLEQILRSDYGYKNIEVVNAAVVGYDSWSNLVNLSFRVLNLQPNLILILDNSRDVTARTGSPDCYVGGNPINGLSPRSQVWTPTVRAPSPSAFYRYLAFNLAWMDDPLRVLNSYYKNNLCQRNDGGSAREHVEQNPPTYFTRNLRNMVAIAQANDVRVLLSTEAYYRQADPDVMKDWWKVAVDEQNQIIQSVAREFDTGMYDLMGAIDQNPDFWIVDGFHPTAEGHQEYARLYAAYLVQSGLLDDSPS
jgi:lysophospholipase L1-like esterase